MKLHAPPQLEDPDAAVVVVRPAFRQNRSQGQIGLRDAEKFSDLEHQLIAAAVVDPKGIDRAVGHRYRGFHGAAGRRSGHGAARG
jgi:hypothetical protein